MTSRATLFADVEIEIAKMTFMKKDGSGSATYYFARDYFAADAIYSGSPVVYPLLAQSPRTNREVGINFSNKNSLDISLFGSNDFTGYNYSLNDFLKLYEHNTATVQILYYCKPQAGTTTHSDSVNIRQSTKVINSSYDESTGVLTFSCQDVLFKNKEVSKKLSLDIFPDLDPKFDGLYGSTVFGQATIAANGIPIESPFIESEINGASVPVAKIFTGWAYTSHPNSTKRRVLVKNDIKYFKRNEWTELEMPSDPQTAGGGNMINLANLYNDPVSHDRDLSINERALVIGTLTTKGYICNAVRAGMILPSYDRCADLANTQYLWNAGNQDFLSRGDEDWSLSLFLKFDSLTGMICNQGWDDANKLEWALFHNGSSQLQFSISSNGTSIAHSVVTGTVSTSTWYLVTLVYDTAANKIYIYLNTTGTNTNISNFLAQRNGRFSIGRMSANAGLDGQAYQFRYWRRALSSSDVTTLYNSGVPLFYQDLPDAQKVDLAVSCPLNEPVGKRIDEHGGADLSEGAQSGNSTVVRYNYSNKPIVVNNDYGELAMECYHAESLDGGNTYSPVGTLLGKGTIDLTKVNLATGSLLTTGTQYVYFQLDPPVVMSEFTNFIFILKYNNDRTNTYYPLCYYSTETPTWPHHVRAKRGIEAGKNTKQNYAKEGAAMLDMQTYYIGDGGGGWVNGTITGTHKYSYQDLEAVTIALMSGMAQKEFNNDLDFKVCIDGLVDDGSGTYTGTVSALIQNPSDIIRFTLLNSEFGVGLSSGNIVSSTFTSVRTSLSNAGLGAAKIVVNQETDAEEFIYEVARQFRIVFYTTREGKLALYYPVNFTSASYVISQLALKENAYLVNFRPKDYNSVINRCNQYYKPDTINLNIDLSLLRLDERQRLVGKLYLDANESTMSDTARQSLSSTSQSIYGVREMNFDLSFYDDKSAAYRAQKYYFDRYYKLPNICVYRVPRKDYLTTDFFDKVSVQDEALPSTYKSTKNLRTFHTNAPVTLYYEGVPVVDWVGGEIKGEVVGIQEQGSDMFLTVETLDNTFEV